MSTAIFLLGIVAFLVVMGWAYDNDGAREADGHKGLLAMKRPGEEAVQVKPAPRWRTSSSPGAAPSVRTPAPGWRAGRGRGRQP